VSAFQDVEDQQDASGVDLSENVACDYISYHRGEVVGHEEQGLLMLFSLVTGWAASKSTHNNVIGIGPPGSGKSLTMNTVEGLLDDGDTYTKTSASNNAILDSVQWDLSLCAPMDELDKIDKPIVEVLKSSNPEDDGYSKDRNVEDPDARGGYSPEEVSADAIPWGLLYAPSSKKATIDDELEDRALILYFSNNKHTRRSIGRKEFGHDSIDIGGASAEEYIYDTHALAARLRTLIRNLPTESYYEEIDGENRLVGRAGGTHIYMPWWVWYACEPIFNVDEDYTNRVYGLVANCIEASALINYQNRDRTAIEVYVDEDSTETETHDAIVVEPQDVANVLSCFPTLLSTTHQLTPLKRHILDAVDATQLQTDGDGTTVSRVQDWLEENDIPHPARSTLKSRMDELAEEYYLDRFQNAGGKNGKADVYEQPPSNAGAIETPRVYDLDDHARREDDLSLPVDDCVDIDPSDPFADCTDPIRDQPFTETVSDFEAQFAGQSDPDTDASSFMGGGSEEPSSATDSDSGGQAALTDVSNDGVETDGVDTDGEIPSIELDPEGEPANPTEHWVFEQIQNTNGPYGSTDDVVNFVGAVPQGGSPTDVDMDGTVLDPEHELWQNRPDMVDDRVISEGDCLTELNDAYKSLREADLVGKDDGQGPPAMYEVVTADL